MPQKFPTDTPFTPYDDVSWALPAHYGVEAKAIGDEKIKADHARSRRRRAADGTRRRDRAGLSSPRHRPGSAARGSGRGSPAFRCRGRRARLRRSRDVAADTDYPAGSWIVRRAARRSPTRSSRVARELCARFRRRSHRPGCSRDTRRRCRASPSGTPGTTPSRSAGSATRSISRRSHTPTSATTTSARAGCARSTTSSCSGTTTSACRARFTASTSAGGRCRTRRRREFPSHGVPDCFRRHHRRDRLGRHGEPPAVLEEGGLLVTLGNGSALALEGGLVRGVSPRRRQRHHARARSYVSRSRSPSIRSPTAIRRSTSAFRSVLHHLRRAGAAIARRVVLQWGTKPRKDDREDEDKEKDGAARTKPRNKRRSPNRSSS